MFKLPLTEMSYNEFSSSYQSYDINNLKKSEPYVYVDANGFKVLTTLNGEENQAEGGIFAMSCSEDGWVEMLSF